MSTMVIKTRAKTRPKAQTPELTSIPLQSSSQANLLPPLCPVRSCFYASELVPHLSTTMKFLTGILAIAGLTAALPAPEPGTVDLGDGVKLVPRKPSMNARRSARKTNPRMPATSEGAFTTEGITNETQVSYSSNWAGAVLVGSGYKSVTGSIVVPTPKMPSGGSSSTQYSASAWVGIDGDTCQTAILQTGVDFNVQGSSVSFDAWYEW